MPLTLISHDFLRETIHDEILLAKGFDDLSKALADIVSNRLAVALRGDSDDTRLSGSLDRFKKSVIAKAWNDKHKIPAQMVSDFFDSYLAVRAQTLESPASDEKDIVEAAEQIFGDLKGRIGEAVAHQKGAELVVVGEDVDSKDEALEEYKTSDENIILVDPGEAGGGKQPEKGVPVEIFGEQISDSGFDWNLTEIVKRLYCEEETPELGKDDIILQGTFVYRGIGPESLKISPAEVDYGRGDSHSYLRPPNTVPHTGKRPIVLIDEGSSLYISTHLITESDQWTELAEILAGLLSHAVSNPIAQLSSAFTGVTSGIAPGLSTGTALAGAALDALTNHLSNDLLNKAGRKVHDTIYELISSIGIKQNIIFDTWFTAALIRWVVLNGVKTPKWEVRHYAFGNSRYNRPAEPKDDNPKTGAGILHPSHYFSTPDVILRPAIYDPEAYENITGKYWYESSIQVVKRYFDN